MLKRREATGRKERDRGRTAIVIGYSYSERMEPEATRILVAVNESSLKGYPHPSISSRTAFEWTLAKIIRSNTAGFMLLFLHVQVPDEDGQRFRFSSFFFPSSAIFLASFFFRPIPNYMLLSRVFSCCWGDGMRSRKLRIFPVSGTIIKCLGLLPAILLPFLLQSLISFTHSIGATALVFFAEALSIFF